MADRDVLSHEEIDALLTNVEQDQGDEATGEGQKSVQPYELGSKTAPRHGRLPVLEMIGERFARAARKSLENQLRQPVDVGAAGIESHNFEALSKRLSVPASISVVELAPIAGHCLFVLSADLVERFVDRYFGGLSEAPPEVTSGRDFTPTEKRVIGRVRDQLSKDLCAAWKDIIPISFRMLSEESNPHLVNVYAQDDELLVVEYPIGFCGASGLLSIVMPHEGLAPYLARLGAAGRSEDEAEDPHWQAALEALLLDTEVEAQCCIATKQVRLIDLMNLAPGDVLNVEMPQVHELVVDRVTVLKGSLQEAAGKLVIEQG